MLRCAALAISLFAVTVSLQAGQDRTLYALTIEGKLLKVDPATAAAQEIATIGVPILTQYVGFDVNVDGRAYVGQYTVGLYRIDLETGAATFVASNPPQDFIFENMGFARRGVPGPDHHVPAGTLFTSAFGQLYMFNLHTRDLRFIGWTGHDDDGFAMAPDGTLYAVDAFLAFYRIDTATAQSTVISTAPPCLVSLTYGPDDYLYCTDPSRLWRLDPRDGSATLMGDIGRYVIGLAFAKR
jgi:hypothetical protein